MGGSDTGGAELLSGVRAGRRLREAWCRRSRDTGWEPPDDWWAPAVDAVCAAAVSGADMSPACARFGRSRARSGVGIGAALDDFAALSDVLRWPAPPMPLVKALAEGWVEAGHAHDDCQDPLTGLSTAAYLRARLGELYQAAGPSLPPSASHRLILIALDRRLDPWRRTARMIVLGHELRRFFHRGETIALLSRSRVAVLAPASAGLDVRLLGLRATLAREHAAELWSALLPGSHRAALAFLNDVGCPVDG
ncbi:hypothetical protein ACFOVU_19290 [Nocardiopsis sediminis]|uniref:GGDEF domain-containing protein n=1 Tax=Nocardiopsis sediminis TaxID=1778267 RepID=A0ABV8FSM6_9ACTN